MHILVLNVGSTSIKISLYTLKDLQKKLSFEVKFKDKKALLISAKKNYPFQITTKKSLFTPLLKKLNILIADYPIWAIAHRLVHGGKYFKQSVVLKKGTLEKIKKLSKLAPTHNPVEIAAIEVAQKIWPKATQIIHFDTAFFHTLSSAHKTIPIASKLQSREIMRYGFHGLSHEYCLNLLFSNLPKATKNLKVIICHLGGGSSISANVGKKCIDTTMGFSPLDGLVMNTRPGSLDPGLLIYLLKNKKVTLRELEDLLEHKSGLLGISKTLKDVKDLLRKEKSSKNCSLALQVYISSIVKNIASMMSSISGCDHLIFTGGVGENIWQIRSRCIEQLGFMNIFLDHKINKISAATKISNKSSQVSVWVFKTDENLNMAQKSQKFL